MERAERTGARPVVVTADLGLRDAIEGLCAAAGLPPALHTEPGDLRAVWSQARCVLLGDDLAPLLIELSLPRRQSVLVVARGPASEAVWRAALTLRADEVCVLPAQRARLVDWLGDLEDGPSSAATWGFLGGSGGAGATTLAAAVALSAARAGLVTTLVDADPMGGGIDLTVGCEDQPGLRWADMAVTHGRVRAADLRAALPKVGDLAVLSWGRGAVQTPAPDTVSAVLRAARRGCDVVVVDLPRRTDGSWASVVPSLDVLALVTVSDVRGVAAATRSLDCVRQACPDVRAVVRDVPGSPLDHRAVADALGLAVLGVIPTRTSVARSVNEGLGPLQRGGLDRACRSLVARLLDGEETRR